MPIPHRPHLLVIDDNPDLIREATSFFDSFDQGTTRTFKLRISYASTLQEALPLIPEVNGVLCDILFPTDSPDGPLRLHSVEVVNRCRALRKPIAVLQNELDEAHYDLKAQIKASVVRETPIFGINMKGLREFEGYDPAPNWKPWNQALHGLLYLLGGLEYGAFQFSSVGDIVPRMPFPEFCKERRTAVPEFSDEMPMAVVEVRLDYKKKWGKSFEKLHPFYLRQWAWLFTSTDPKIQWKRREILEEDFLSQLLQTAIYPYSEEGRQYREERLLSSSLRKLYLLTKSDPSTPSEGQSEFAL